MGNRAVITTRKNLENNGVGIYLHWNGGRDSVEAFLKYCELKGFRSPSEDNYGWARLCQVIGNFFGGSYSIGIDTVDNLDCNNGDNGTYIIDGWNIVDRKFFNGLEQNNYNLEEMLQDINDSQPEAERLPKEIFITEDVPTSEIVVGDNVLWYDNLYHKYTVETVVGIGENQYVNGTNVLGVPYIDKYSKDGSRNINNYLLSSTVKRVVVESEND